MLIVETIAKIRLAYFSRNAGPRRATRVCKGPASGNPSAKRSFRIATVDVAVGGKRPDGGNRLLSVASAHSPPPTGRGPVARYAVYLGSLRRDPRRRKTASPSGHSGSRRWTSQSWGSGRMAGTGSSRWRAHIHRHPPAEVQWLGTPCTSVPYAATLEDENRITHAHIVAASGVMCLCRTFCGSRSSCQGQMRSQQGRGRADNWWP